MSTSIKGSIGCSHAINTLRNIESTTGSPGCTPNADASSRNSDFYTDYYENPPLRELPPKQEKLYQKQIESFRADASDNALKTLWDNATMVVVSGSGPNPCGHALLRIGEPGDQHYFHTDALRDRPFYMDETGYQTYLQQEGKTQLHEEPINVRNPQATHQALNESITQKHLWTALPTNCVTYIEDIIRKGGEPDYDPYNCPRLNIPRPPSNTPPLDNPHNIYGISGI